MPHVKVIKNGQKYFLWTFSGFLVTIISDVKIDINMSIWHVFTYVGHLDLLGIGQNLFDTAREKDHL